MPSIVTTVHDAAALAETCLRLGLPVPEESYACPGGIAAFGWVVRLPGLRGPLVLDTLTGLAAYDARDNAHERYARIIRFLHRYYDVRAAPRREEGRRAALRADGRPVAEGAA
jgi:hypothetical protein